MSERIYLGSSTQDVRMVNVTVVIKGVCALRVMARYEQNHEGKLVKLSKRISKGGMCGGRTEVLDRLQ